MNWWKTRTHEPNSLNKQTNHLTNCCGPGSICGNTIPEHSMSIPSNSAMRERQSGTELIQISMHDWVAIHLRWFSMSQSPCAGPTLWLGGSTNIHVLWAYEKFRDDSIPCSHPRPSEQESSLQGCTVQHQCQWFILWHANFSFFELYSTSNTKSFASHPPV